jgi:Tfp pilus assembly protein PilV
MAFHLSVRTQAGITLIEVMVALLVGTFGLLAAANMQVLGRYCIGKAHRGMINCAAAAAQMERIRTMDYDDPRLSDTDDGYHPQNADHGPYPVSTAQSAITWEVDDDFPTPRTKRITVTITFTSRGGIVRTYQYDTIKSKDCL